MILTRHNARSRQFVEDHLFRYQEKERVLGKEERSDGTHTEESVEKLFKTGVSNPSYLGLKNTLKIVKSVGFNSVLKP